MVNYECPICGVVRKKPGNCSGYGDHKHKSTPRKKHVPENDRIFGFGKSSI